MGISVLVKTVLILRQAPAYLYLLGAISLLTYPLISLWIPAYVHKMVFTLCVHVHMCVCMCVCACVPPSLYLKYVPAVFLRMFEVLFVLIWISWKPKHLNLNLQVFLDFAHGQLQHDEHDPAGERDTAVKEVRPRAWAPSQYKDRLICVWRFLC